MGAVAPIPSFLVIPHGVESPNNKVSKETLTLHHEVNVRANAPTVACFHEGNLASTEPSDVGNAGLDASVAFELHSAYPFVVVCA